MPKFFIDLNIDGRVISDQHGMDAEDYKSARELSLNTIAEVLKNVLVTQDCTVSSTLFNSERVELLRCTTSLMIEIIKPVTPFREAPTNAADSAFDD